MMTSGCNGRLCRFAAIEKGQTKYVKNNQKNADQRGPAGRMPGRGDRKR